MRAKQFERGDILEVSLVSGKHGSARVLRLDDFGLLLQLANPATGKFDGGEGSPVVYVNPVSVRSWRKVGRCDVQEVLDNLPTFFYGSSAYAWTIQSGDSISYIKGSDSSAEELRRRGFVHKILWLAKNIEEWVEQGKPLIWPFSL